MNQARLSCLNDVLFCCFMSTYSSYCTASVSNTYDFDKDLSTYTDTEFFDSTGKFDPNLDKGAFDKKIFVKVPTHLRGFETPKNINSFLTDLHPNMVIFITDKLGTLTSVKTMSHKEITNDIITNFLCYFLGQCTKNNTSIKRYELYDPIKYSKIPYYRWVLNNLGFFIKSFKQSFYNEQKENLLLISTDQNLYSENADYVMNLASLSNPMISIEETDVMLSIRNSIIDFMKTTEVTEYVYMLEIFEELSKGHKIKQICELLSLPRKIINDNLTKLKALLLSTNPNIKEELFACI